MHKLNSESIENEQKNRKRKQRKEKFDKVFDILTRRHKDQDKQNLITLLQKLLLK